MMIVGKITLKQYLNEKERKYVSSLTDEGVTDLLEKLKAHLEDGTKQVTNADAQEIEVKVVLHR